LWLRKLGQRNESGNHRDVNTRMLKTLLLREKQVGSEEKRLTEEENRIKSRLQSLDFQMSKGQLQQSSTDMRIMKLEEWKKDLEQKTKEIEEHEQRLVQMKEQFATGQKMVFSGMDTETVEKAELINEAQPARYNTILTRKLALLILRNGRKFEMLGEGDGSIL
jgi:uncharacterized protein (DUF3084 family)